MSEPSVVMLDGSEPPERVARFAQLMVDDHRKGSKTNPAMFGSFEEGFALVKWVRGERVRLAWTIPHRFRDSVLADREAIERSACLVLPEDSRVYVFSTFEWDDQEWPHIVVERKEKV